MRSVFHGNPTTFALKKKYRHNMLFAIIMFTLEKIPLGLTATIVAVGLNLTGVQTSSSKKAPPPIQI